MSLGKRANRPRFVNQETESLRQGSFEMREGFIPRGLEGDYFDRLGLSFVNTDLSVRI